MNAFQFIKDVPVDWSESVAVNGEIGDYVTIARKDRRSDNWYLGSVTDESARTLSVKLDFLEPGKSYRAQIYRDGEGADWKSNPQAIAIESRNVTRDDTLTLPLAAGGGAAVRFVTGHR
jgi:alpha-glucosidase